MQFKYEPLQQNTGGRLFTFSATKPRAAPSVRNALNLNTERVQHEKQNVQSRILNMLQHMSYSGCISPVQ